MVTTFIKWYIAGSYASSVSHPAFCSVGMGVAWLAADHSCPFTVRVVLCLSVCEGWGSWTATPLNACVARTQKQLYETKLHWKHWIRFLSEEWLLHIYYWVQLASASPGHKWLFPPPPRIGGLVAATFCGFVWTPLASIAKQFEAVWMMQGRRIWSSSFSSKRVDNGSFFLSLFPPILDSKEARAFLFVASWKNFPEEKKFVPFSYVCIPVGLHFTVLVVL
jgi:hypothetical protein